MKTCIDWNQKQEKQLKIKPKYKRSRQKTKEVKYGIFLWYKNKQKRQTFK